MKICFDYGHGGDDVGAVGFGIVESHSVLEIGQLTADIMRSQGHEVIETRTSDCYVSLMDRCNISNNDNCDYFVSFHNNGYCNGNANGVETWHYPTSETGANFARVLQNHLVAGGLFASDRGIKSEDFVVLEYTEAPAILLELGFITNKQDNIIIDTRKHDIARIVSNGIFEFIGGSTGLPAPAPAPATGLLDVDGYMGTETISALQKYLGTYVDGVISSPSEMVKELQRRLNNGVL